VALKARCIRSKHQSQRSTGVLKRLSETSGIQSTLVRMKSVSSPKVVKSQV
jgi:hypothetical protein